MDKEIKKSTKPAKKTSTKKVEDLKKETAKVAEKRAIKNCKNGEELNGNGFRGDGIKGKKCKLVMMLSPDFKLEDKRSGETFELKVTSSI